MTITFTSIAAVLLTQFSQVQKPKELAQAEAVLQRFQTAHIEWSIEYLEDGLEEFSTTRIANGDRLEISRGNWQGCRYEGSIGELWGCANYTVLENREGLWNYVEESAAADFSPKDTAGRKGAMTDVATIGTFPSPQKWGDDVVPDQYYGQPVLEYSTEWNDNLCTVSALLELGGRIVWELDASRDFVCTRCTAIDDNGLVVEAVTEYEDHGSMLCPKSVVYSRRLSEYEFVPSKRISVIHATFDDPAHPASLGPELLNMIPLTNISSSDKTIPLRWWDGKRVIFEKEWRARIGKDLDDEAFSKHIDLINEGKICSQPKTFAMTDDDVMRKPGLWEEYVREFIRHHRLNREQTRDAWKALTGAQEKAGKYLKKTGGYLAEIEQLLAKEREHQNALRESERPINQSERAIERLEVRADRLHEPVERIFQRVLKPSLVSLLNEQQRRRMKEKLDEENRRQDSDQ